MDNKTIHRLKDTLFFSCHRLLRTKIPLCSIEVVEPQMLNAGKCLEKHWCTGAHLFPLFWLPKNPQDWALLWNGTASITAIRLLNWQGSKGKTKTTHISDYFNPNNLACLFVCVFCNPIIPVQMRGFCINLNRNTRDSSSLTLRFRLNPPPCQKSTASCYWHTNPAFPLVMCRSLNWQFLLGWRNHITPPPPSLSSIFCFVPTYTKLVAWMLF